MRYHQYPKRDPIKNYFPLPNELFVLGLSAGEIAVYAFLMRYENRNNYTCVVSYKEIGAAVRMSKNTVKVCGDAGGAPADRDAAHLCLHAGRAERKRIIAI